MQYFGELTTDSGNVEDVLHKEKVCLIQNGMIRLFHFGME